MAKKYDAKKPNESEKLIENGVIIENDDLSLNYYNKLANGEELKKKWQFTEYVEEGRAKVQRKIETEITVTDKRLILLSDDGYKINKISRNIEDIYGVGYTVKKKPFKGKGGKIVITLGAIACWAFAFVMLLGALIGPLLVSVNNAFFKYAYIIVGVALVVSIFFLKRLPAIEQRAYATILEFYVKPYQEVQPLGNMVFGKDRSVVEVCVPEGEEVVSMIAEIDNLITEMKYGSSTKEAKQSTPKTTKPSTIKKDKKNEK